MQLSSKFLVLAYLKQSPFPSISYPNPPPLVMSIKTFQLVTRDVKHKSTLRILIIINHEYEEVSRVEKRRVIYNQYLPEFSRQITQTNVALDFQRHHPWTYPYLPYLCASSLFPVPIMGTFTTLEHSYVVAHS